MQGVLELAVFVGEVQLVEEEEEQAIPQHPQLAVAGVPD